MEVGLYAGSFDPVHLGHVAVITTGAGMLDRLVVVVAENHQKPTGMFSVIERVEMLTEACRPFPNVRVEAHAGLLVDMAGRVGATVLVRSAGKEHNNEKRMAYLNGSGGLPTLLLPSDPATAYISSSQVRSLIAVGALDALVRLLPETVLKRLQEDAHLLKAGHRLIR